MINTILSRQSLFVNSSLYSLGSLLNADFCTFCYLLLYNLSVQFPGCLLQVLLGSVQHLLFQWSGFHLHLATEWTKDLLVVPESTLDCRSPHYPDMFTPPVLTPRVWGIGHCRETHILPPLQQSLCKGIDRWMRVFPDWSAGTHSCRVYGRTQSS